MEITRIFDLLENLRKEHPDSSDIIAGNATGAWKKYSAREYAEIVNNLSLGLLKLGVKKNDKIATIILNSPEWTFFDMAITQIGAIMLPIYPTINLSNFKYIFDEAEVKYVVVTNQEIFDNIKPAIDGSNSILDVYSISQVKGARIWTELLDLGRENKTDNLEQIKSDIKPDDIATIIYTSGTTGDPKGVMLSHNNILSNLESVDEVLSKNPYKVTRSISFLPLCHVYERILNYMYQLNGISIYYVDQIEKLGDTMKSVHPEIFGAVPRVIEKTYDKIVNKGRGLSGIKKQLFFWALNLAHDFEFEGKSWVYKKQLALADKLIFSKWREAFGGKLDTIVSGGATLNPRLARTFRAAKIKIQEGYGLTETSPVIAVSRFEPGGVKFGTVGPVFKNVEVKFAEDGEILTKGPCLMKGYYKKDAHTQEVIDEDGWFHTGDIGELVDGYYLKITDRKKEIFKTSGGKYIAPQVVENKFKESPFIESIIVLGENKSFASALIVPSFEHLESWCKVKNHPYESPDSAIKDQRIVDRIRREVNIANQDLDKFEQVNSFKLLPENFSVEKGELSPTLKLRRKVIIEKYKDLIAEIYS
jgi:long-chain acyl-CoA synthetase